MPDSVKDVWNSHVQNRQRFAKMASEEESRAQARMTFS